MNRRNFLKRIAAVGVGAVAVPTVAKNLPFKLNSVQKRILNTTTVSKGVTLEQATELAKLTLEDMPKYTALPCLHETHGGKLGDRIVCRYCGRHYTFVKMEVKC